MDVRVIRKIERDIELSRQGLGQGEREAVVGLFESIITERDDTFFDHVAWHRYFDWWSWDQGTNFERVVPQYFEPEWYLQDPETFFVRWRWLKEVHTQWLEEQVADAMGDR